MEPVFNEQRPFPAERVSVSEPRASIQIDRSSLRIFSQADIDRMASWPDTP